jgi:hypothetical protein
MARLLIAAITDLLCASARSSGRDKFTYLGHRELALESAPHPIVNTLGLPPSLLYAFIAVGLMPPTKCRVSRSDLSINGDAFART